MTIDYYFGHPYKIISCIALLFIMGAYYIPMLMDINVRFELYIQFNGNTPHYMLCHIKKNSVNKNIVKVINDNKTGVYFAIWYCYWIVEKPSLITIINYKRKKEGNGFILLYNIFPFFKIKTFGRFFFLHSFAILSQFIKMNVSIILEESIAPSSYLNLHVRSRIYATVSLLKFELFIIASININ